MKIYQRLIYPDTAYTTSFSVKSGEYMCYTSPVVETHFWVDDGNLGKESPCKCGKEKLGEVDE